MQIVQVMRHWLALRKGELKPVLSVLLLVPLLAASAESRRCWTLDASDPGNQADEAIVTTLQGILNRDQPRLFLRTFFWIDPSSDDAWMEYLTQAKAYSFEEIPSLNDAIVKFRELGLIKGLVAYDDKNWAAACVAAMIGGRDNLLPVSKAQLAYATPLLDGRNQWFEDDPKGVRWQGWFGNAKRDAGTLKVTREKDRLGGVQRVVALDPERTPYLALTVTAASHQWGVMVNDGSVPAEDGIWLVEPTARTGEIVVDLRGKLRHPGPRVFVRLIPIGPAGATLSMTGLRWLDADKRVPAAKAAKTARCFEGFSIVTDLRGKFADEQDAWRWALSELLPGSNREMAFSASPGWWNIVGLDLAIARGAFIYRENLRGDKALTRPLPVLDAVIQHLKPPAAILGWESPEWLNTYRISRAGHFVECSGAPNLSFWQHVPTDNPVVLPNRRSKTGPLEEKIYVVIQVGDGDAPKTLAGFMNKYSDWRSPSRGKVAVNWGVPPWMNDVAPAMLEYYARTATPNDGFFAGPSGLGYCNPTLLPNLAEFAAKSRRLMKGLGLETIDLWDFVYFRAGELHREFGRDGVTRAYTQAPPSPGWPVMNTWLDDGTPVFTSSDNNEDRTGLWALVPPVMDRDDLAGDLARRIERVVAEKDGPFFLLHYAHLPLETYVELARRLPADRVEIVTMADMVHYGRLAGAFTVEAAGSGVSPGETVNIEIAVRNPDGETGANGEVRWDLPEGWTASESGWKYPAIPQGTTLLHTLHVTASTNAAVGDARIRFRDSRFPWRRTVRLRTYPYSRMISDFHDDTGWQSFHGGTLTASEGIGQFGGTIGGSGMRREVEIDFDRQPVIELNATRLAAKWALSLKHGSDEIFLLKDRALGGRITIPLADKTAWTGKQKVQLLFYPGWSLGRTADLDWLKIYYAR
jgi:hypothetical protein